MRTRRGRLALFTAAAISLFIGFVWGRSVLIRSQSQPLLAVIHPARLTADGYEIATLTLQRPGGKAAAGPPTISFPENAHAAVAQQVTETENGWRVQIRAGVMPGRVVVRAAAPDFLPAAAKFTTTLDPADREGDGTPDFLRLDATRDEQAFRRWFTFLAEAQYFQPPESRPAEINDCAALIRYAYREALRLHDDRWASDARLPLIPAFESISKYQYPFTPLGAALFRVRSGSFQPSDLADGGTFAQFADAQTLQRLNTHLVTRDPARAQPGDLLFFRLVSESMPFHSMIFLGNSQITMAHENYVVYHTGPDGSNPGEMRRPSVQELMRHPDPHWRPIGGNPSFLGVYRWNILRRAD